MVSCFVPESGMSRGHRPAVVLSPFSYNNKSELLLCVPFTTESKDYPFEVEISGEHDGVALADQCGGKYPQ
ncbi:hypothetical protein YC94_004925 [Salmonella enterica subsp. diarizonae]|nr:hypothetical protein [Salmonella enterica subsp. arizonae]EEJ3294072.1 hypothetical protein [Salmonella enterica subsp. diarizonae]